MLQEISATSRSLGKGLPAAPGELCSRISCVCSVERYGNRLFNGDRKNVQFEKRQDLKRGLGSRYGKERKGGGKDRVGVTQGEERTTEGRTGAEEQKRVCREGGRWEMSRSSCQTPVETERSQSLWCSRDEVVRVGARSSKAMGGLGEKGDFFLSPGLDLDGN